MTPDRTSWTSSAAGCPAGGARCGLSADAPTSKTQTSCLVSLYAARIAALARPATDVTTKQVQTLRVTPDGHMTTR